ncbi:MAG: group II intron maturase-specific domain-containing protein [Solirubrobacteraceae bacterium]
MLIRYADDFVVHCHTRQEALEVQGQLAVWLTPRGLAFNDDKTRVVSLDDGFDFLRFNVRRYRGKLLIKPSKAAVRRIRERLRTELRSLRGSNAQAVIKRLNPIIRGWAAYYWTQVSADTFGKLDSYLWRLTLRWAKVSHSNKPTHWCSPGTSTSSTRPDRTGGCSGAASAAPTSTDSPGPTSSATRSSDTRRPPDDPELADYWAWRQRKAPLPINHTALCLNRAQDGRCAICNRVLVAVEDRPQTPREWEQWLATTRKTIDVVWEPGMTDTAQPRLIHLGCHPTRQPSGLA